MSADSIALPRVRVRKKRKRKRPKGWDEILAVFWTLHTIFWAIYDLGFAIYHLRTGQSATWNIIGFFLQIGIGRLLWWEKGFRVLKEWIWGDDPDD